MISLVLTVKNERKLIPQWFESIKQQSIQPEEMVVVDGGSNDGTWQFLNEMKNDFPKLKVFREEGNIAHGRNFAIRQCSGDSIVVTDAGCTYDKNWFKSFVDNFSKKETMWSATAFAPWFMPEDGAVIHAIAASTIPASPEFKKDWLPSSRSVGFRKDRWQTVGGYPEWVPFCEDVLLDLKLKRKDGFPVFVREPLVFWRPRTTISSYLKQLYNYTRSEGHAKLNFNRQLIRFFVYTFSFVCLVLALSVNWYYILPVLVGLPFYMVKFWRRWFAYTKQKSPVFKLLGLFLVPGVVFLGDCAKMAGYLSGDFELSIGKVKYEG